MALRPRLRYRLAVEARRLAGALSRWADDLEPRGADPARGGPPEHWLALVRARAPQLLEGGGIGIRDGGHAGVPGAPAPDPPPAPDPSAGRRPAAAGAAPVAPRARHRLLRWPRLAEPFSAAARRWPWSPVPAPGRPPTWPAGGRSRPAGRRRAGAGPPGVPGAPSRAPEPRFPGPDPAPRPRWRWPAPVRRRWPARRDTALVPLPGSRLRRAPPPAPGPHPSPAAGAGAGAEALGGVAPTGAWPEPPGTPARPTAMFPPGGTGRGRPSASWPAAPVRAGAGRPAAWWTGRPGAGAPAGAFAPVAAPAARASAADGAGRPGRWPALPDDGEQRRPAPALGGVDPDRARRLDGEQRGE